MAFDPASLFDVSHLATFLGGTIVGAAGSYMADRFTDRRRKKEAISEAKQRFLAIQNLIPDLIAEIKADLGEPEKQLIREFVCLSNNRIIFNHDRPRFQYYETDHPDLTNKIQFLVDEGYVRDVSTTSHPIYRMSDEFVAFLDGTGR